VIPRQGDIYANGVNEGNRDFVTATFSGLQFCTYAVSTVASSCIPYCAFHCSVAALRCGTNKTAQVRDLHTGRAVVPTKPVPST